MGVNSRDQRRKWGTVVDCRSCGEPRPWPLRERAAVLGFDVPNAILMAAERMKECDFRF
jgi:hypothetical protein